MRTDLEREMYELKETIEDWAFDEIEETVDETYHDGFVDEKTELPF